jgi:acid phosphatase
MRAWLTALAALAAAASGAAAADEPRPPATPEQIVAYRDSGEWDRDLAAVASRAATQVGAHDGPRATLVLDVDDTSLSNYECLRAVGFDRPAAGDSCARSASLPAIPQIRSLFRLARSRGVAVVFLTGRRERLRRATVRNLRAAGYRGRWRLFMRPNRQPAARRDGWKARVRRSLVRRGARIVANVGDQRSDLDGGWARRRFKLPNPMYVIAEA